MFSDAAHWLSGYNEGTPLALQLADAGFDIWLGNNKGTEYSQTHNEYDAKEVDFWKFGWSEMGLYDVTSNVDYIKSKTGAEKIHYLGYQ